MNINGKTTIIVNGKFTRVCGHEFNRALRAGGALRIFTTDGKAILPSKGWEQAVKAIRAGKSFQAKTVAKSADLKHDLFAA